MKKLITILIAAAMVVTFTACSSDTADESDTTTQDTAETTEKIVNENLLTVEITIPASWFDEDNPATDELTDEQIADGFDSATVNDDGSVTYKMSKSAFNDYKEKLRQSTCDTIDNISTDYPCVQSSEYTDNFSEVTLYVSESEYNSGSNSFCGYTVAVAANFYQTYTNETVSCEVSIVNADTDEVIDTVVLPQE